MNEYKSDYNSNASLNIGVKTVEELDFDRFVIPPYQRPYKWQAKHVNQLISDLTAFQCKDRYRLGTLVLHNNEIVDGQQRVITITLLIKKIIDKLANEQKTQFDSIIGKVEHFAESTRFHNKISLHNIVENVKVMEARDADLNVTMLNFLFHKCEFVVVSLDDLTEAFQFFDSQNARGKDLQAHDLLKAYHLREIETMSHLDISNFDMWQNYETTKLHTLFLTLFRAKRWSQSRTARLFGKNDVNAFKGISLRDGKRYPFYEMEVIAHMFTEFYNNSPLRKLDGQHIAYPFNLDDQIVNGSRFFDMIRHYLSLYQDVETLHETLFDGEAKNIMSLVVEYDKSWRTGDKYVRELFFTVVLYYIDRFGKEELDKVIPKLFIWAYTLRMQRHAVQLASIDNYATETHSMFKVIHKSQTPYDIINIYQEPISGPISNLSEDLKAKFIELKKWKA